MKTGLLYYCLKMFLCSLVCLFPIFQNVISIAMLNKQTDFMDSEFDTIIANYISSKGYLPNDIELPKSTIINNADTDVTYLLSKLSDEELIKLLNEQPKKAEYNLNDILKINSQNNLKSNYDQRHIENLNTLENADYSYKRFKILKDNEKKADNAIFRLNHKEVNPYVQNTLADPKYEAFQKLHNLLYRRPQSHLNDKSTEDEERKELIFDFLVAQLKSLCCKRKKSSNKLDIFTRDKLKSLLGEYMPLGMTPENPTKYESAPSSLREHIFLIINDEVKNTGSDELIYVDPESLQKNSSVLLLGPITNQMTDSQLKLVMKRITNELSKPEYLPLIIQLSEGRLNEENVNLSESLITGPNTRRYIKPHRCNHQSKLARLYGGPKWLICTGYLNTNAPSLYD